MPDEKTRKTPKRASARSAPKTASTRVPAARGPRAKAPAKPLKKPAKAPAKKPAKAPAKALKKPVALVKKPLRRKVATAAAAPPPAVQADPVEARRAQAREFAKWIAVAGIEKKAERIEIIDVGEKVDYADFLVLMSGRSDRQVQAIAGGIDDAMRGRGQRPQRIEGMSQGHWVLVDYADVIVHVFLEDARRYYDLESLWMDARRVPFEVSNPPSLRPSHGEIPVPEMT